MMRRTTTATAAAILVWIVAAVDAGYYDRYNGNNYAVENNQANYGGGANGGAGEQYNMNNNGQANSNYNGMSNNARGLPIYTCEDSVVELTYLAVWCDSPYTFYYGNGANRNSQTCEYSDKATVQGTVTLVDNLQYGDSIYITMAIYDDSSNLLVTSGPVDFCKNLVGYDCTMRGTFSFVTKLRLETPQLGNRTDFYPVVQMAFSTQKDYGYNLGAANMYCEKWDDHNGQYSQQGGHVLWGEQTERSAILTFFVDNGMLIGVSVALCAVGYFIWIHATENEKDARHDTLQKGAQVPLYQPEVDKTVNVA